MPGHDHSIELQNLPLEAEQLSAERGKARAGNLRYPFVARVGNNMQQLEEEDARRPSRERESLIGERTRSPSR